MKTNKEPQVVALERTKASKQGEVPILIKDLINSASNRLKKSKPPSDSPKLDAELLLAHCLNKNRTYLHTWPEQLLSKSQVANFESLLLKRLDEYPIAYILGSKAFWTLDLIVTPDVLIPRPETELLVEIALEKIADIKKPKVLDLGTGSGAIALSIASERPDARITATDFSNEALEVAKTNAKDNNLSSQVIFIQSDWFTDISNDKNSRNETFDLIVSNPPYIEPNDLHLLESIRYEPQQALIAQQSGMQDIEHIIQNSPTYLKMGGWILLEHGYKQGRKTCDLLTSASFVQATTLKDLSQNPRISCAKLE